MTAVTLFGITFVLVFLLGIQQLNVQFGQYAQAWLTSLAIAALQLALLKLMPQPTSWVENAGYLFGGPFGIWAAMHFHSRLSRLFERGRQLLRRQG